MLTAEQGVAGLLESGRSELSAHRREILEELGEGLAGFEVVKQGVEKHAVPVNAGSGP